LKEIFVDGDVLVRDEALTWLVLIDGIDQHGRMAVTEAVEQYRDVERHGGDRIPEIGM
jgi:hypothetical protein